MYKIILVDDEKVILRTVSSDLQEEGFQVDVAESGEEAVVKMQQNHYDLVVTDLLMDGIDGIQVLKEAKKNNPLRPVIILTGFSDLRSAVDALRLEADDYLCKPCTLEELLFRIQRALEKYELRKKIQLYEKILPICCFCKQIRDDSGKEPGSGEWMPLEKYFHQQTHVELSHSICRDCLKKHYPVISAKDTDPS